MLNRNSTTPLYEQLKNVIEEQINKNELKENDQLPSERELELLYNVSRITVRQAITLAEKEGLVQRVHGIGTFVKKSKIQQRLNVINTFQSTIEQQGLIASTETLQIKNITADFQLARVLNIDIMESAFNMHLLGFGNNSPIVYYDAYFPADLGNEFAEIAEELNKKGTAFSLLDLYKIHEDCNPTHAEQTIEAVSPSKELGEILQLTDDQSLLKISSIIYDNEIPLEYRKAYYNGDTYKFFITRTIDV